jgi:hypothetical protein
MTICRPLNSNSETDIALISKRKSRRWFPLQARQGSSNPFKPVSHHPEVDRRGSLPPRAGSREHLREASQFGHQDECEPAVS